MFYQEGGQWLETKAEIELFTDGPTARQGPHKVIWPRELGPDWLETFNAAVGDSIAGATEPHVLTPFRKLWTTKNGGSRWCGPMAGRS